MLLSLILSDVFILVTPTRHSSFLLSTDRSGDDGVQVLAGKWLAGDALGFFWVLSLLLQLPLVGR